MSPSKTLDVNGDARFVGEITIETSTTPEEGGQINIIGYGTNADWLIDSYFSQLRILTNHATDTSVLFNNGGAGDMLVGIGTGPNANTIFHVASTTKASIPAPAMTTAERNAVASPIVGMQVYNTTTNKLNVYDGSWTEVGGGSASKTNKTILYQDWTPDMGNYYYIWTHGSTLSPVYNFILQAVETKLGTEMNSDVTLETDTWIGDTGVNWVYNVGAKRYDAWNAYGALYDSSAVSAPTGSSTYLITFTVSNYLAGSLMANVGNTDADTAVSANGTFNKIITASNTDKLKFTGTGFTGSIDDISIKQITGYKQIIPAEVETVSSTQIKIWSSATDPMFLTLI
jgi:hypothetical protein